MEVVKCEAQVRNELGKIATKKCRDNGQVPCVIYGGGKDPVHVTIDRLELTRLFKGKFRYNVMFDIKVSNGENSHQEQVMGYVIDKHAITQELNHVDFKRVEMDEPIRSTITLTLEGTAPGVKKGGVLIHRKTEAKILMAPQDIPERVLVDISSLEVGDSIQIKDIKGKTGVNFIGFDDDVVVRIGKGRGMTADGGEDEDGDAEGEEGAEGAEQAEGGDAAEASAEGGEE